jgi:hypothetical protein
MARDPASGSPKGVWAIARPWPVLGIGLATVVLALALKNTSATPLRGVCLFTGLLLAGVAVSRRLQTAGQALEDRVESAALVAVASFAVLLALLGTDDEWDAIRLFLGVLAGIGLFGSVLVFLPRTPRRVLASLIVLFHFGGITTAVTAVAPRDQPAPWLSMKLLAHVYRPYLTFFYLTNAYHFYSPDPGPPTLLWFRVHWADGYSDWVKLPVRANTPVGLLYQRFLAMAESTNSPMPRTPLNKAEKADYERRTGEQYDHDDWDDICYRRQIGATALTPPLPMVADIMPNLQYSEPQEHAKKLIASYARHVARTTRHPHRPEVPVDSVRVYRLTHRIISPGEIARGDSPLKLTLYNAFYMGKFAPAGKDEKPLDPQDPFLYWYLPIVWVPANYGQPPLSLWVNRPSAPDDRLLNGLAIHAGIVAGLQSAAEVQAGAGK